MSLPGAKLKICIGFSHFQKPVLENQIKLLLVAPHKVGFRGHLSLWTHILFECVTIANISFNQKKKVRKKHILVIYT